MTPPAARSRASRRPAPCGPQPARRVRAIRSRTLSRRARRARRADRRQPPAWGGLATVARLWRDQADPDGEQSMGQHGGSDVPVETQSRRRVITLDRPYRQGGCPCAVSTTAATGVYTGVSDGPPTSRIAPDARRPDAPAIPPSPPAPQPSPAPRPRPRASADGRRPDLPPVRLPRHEPAAGDRLDAGPVPALARPAAARRSPRWSSWAFPASSCSASRQHKDARGSAACDDAGIVQEAVRLIKRQAPGLLVITDVCFCEYTDHGHCGPLTDTAAGGSTWTTTRRCPLLAEQAVSHARAGADVVAPSGMMDGMVRRDPARARRRRVRGPADPLVRGQVRQRLLRPVPRRRREHARPSATAGRTRWTRPTATRRCARSRIDLAEGADLVMVKPALAYLDIVRRVKERFGVPVGRV